MKLLITFSLLLLTSCTQYRYDITYEKCNGHTGSTSYMNRWDPSFDWEQKKIYILDSLWYRDYLNVNNICDFSYTHNEIK